MGHWLCLSVPMELFIKNMVCIRCKMIVKLELERAGLHYFQVKLGSAVTMEVPTADQLAQFRIGLINSGLELMENKKGILIEKIKNVIIEMVYYLEGQLKTNFSDYLSRKLDLDYTYLANIFSVSEGTTIEQFIILLKIKRVKELIWCDEFTLTEISWKLNYSSMAHLSSQFKKVTGISPSHYKQYPDSRHLVL